jgi:hypothetical protein
LYGITSSFEALQFSILYTNMAANDNNGIVLVPGRNEAAVVPGTQFWNLVGADGIRAGALWCLMKILKRV